MDSYQAALELDPVVLEYLENRGIDEETAVRARLGVVDDPIPGHERFVNYLTIPYLDRDGEPLTVRFRCLEEHDHREFYHGKYMTLPEDPARMFSVGSIWRAGNEIHATEGELDAIILNKMGLHAVGLPGVHSWKAHHRRMLAGFSRIWLWADPDEAGRQMTEKITRQLRNTVPVKLEMDVSDTYNNGGKEAVLERLAKAAKGVE